MALSTTVEEWETRKDSDNALLRYAYLMHINSESIVCLLIGMIVGIITVLWETGHIGV